MTAPSSAEPRRGRGLIITGIVLILVGIGLAAAGIIAGFSQIVGLEVQPVNGTTQVDAEAGEQLAIYRTGPVIEGACTAVGPDGAPLPVSPSFGSETVTVNGVQYIVDHVLTARVAGQQAVTCSSGGFAVGPRVGVVGLVGAVLGGIFGGMFVGVLGIVLLIVGIVRRRPKKGPPAGAGPWQGQPPAPGPWQGQPPGPASYPGTWPQGPQGPQGSQGHQGLQGSPEAPY